ncbi:hypothetical protein KBK19_14150 [Microvirga sp. STR05]|uniref:Heavy-metal-associated domain-containing protein n=1 Tax=Hymenobacter duratus TaxID=2771356 RepID=A0ABR8JK33_9BACT|nr:hypothetical protein [Hymenobacter duratus]MBD2716180.1 hypothetical protein [Hymenobacter duratus]MBR7951094.1 hypothetical protein [Microvirga sp. STR05]
MAFLSSSQDDGTLVHINIDQIVKIDLIPSQSTTLVKIMTTRKEADIHFECPSVEVAKKLVADLVDYNDQSKKAVFQVTADVSHASDDTEPTKPVTRAKLRGTY